MCVLVWVWVLGALYPGQTCGWRPRAPIPNWKDRFLEAYGPKKFLPIGSSCDTTFGGLQSQILSLVFVMLA